MEHVGSVADFQAEMCPYFIDPGQLLWVIYTNFSPSVSLTFIGSEFKAHGGEGVPGERLSEFG